MHASENPTHVTRDHCSLIRGGCRWNVYKIGKEMCHSGKCKNNGRMGQNKLAQYLPMNETSVSIAEPPNGRQQPKCGTGAEGEKTDTDTPREDVKRQTWHG